MTVQPLKPVPYPPSRLHAFYNWLDRSRLPHWLFYLLLLGLPGTAQHLLAWQSGALPWWTFNALLGFSTIWLVEVLILGHWVHRRAAKIFQEYQPALQMSSEEYSQALYRFSTFPRRGSVLAFLLGLAVGAATGYAQWQAHAGDIAFLIPGLRIGEWALSNGLNFLIALQVIRQIRQMDGYFPQTLQVDMFNLTPLYAFSRYMAVIGVATFIIAYVTSLVFDPVAFRSSMVALQNSAWVVAILGIFYFSLRRLNRRLRDEKDRLELDANQRLKVMFERLQARVDGESYKEAIEFQSLLASLKIEKEIIHALPTWPWRPGLFSALVSALLLPLALSVIQLLLSKLLNP